MKELDLTSDSPDERFSIRLEDESLSFCASHFITIPLAAKETEQRLILEELHGHNFRVRAVISGPLDENDLLVDFVAARDSLRAILQKCHHKVILADGQRGIKIEAAGEAGEESVAVISRVDSRRWLFPRSEVLLLAAKNASTEAVVRFLAAEYAQTLSERGLFKPNCDYSLTLALEEERGMSAQIEKRIRG